MRQNSSWRLMMRFSTFSRTLLQLPWFCYRFSFGLNQTIVLIFNSILCLSLFASASFLSLSQPRWWLCGCTVYVISDCHCTLIRNLCWIYTPHLPIFMQTKKKKTKMKIARSFCSITRTTRRIIAYDVNKCFGMKTTTCQCERDELRT